VFGASFDVVEAVRSLSQAVDLLTTEVDELRLVRKVVAEQDARLQALEGPAAPRPLVTVGDLVAESTAPAPVRSGKGEAQVGRTDRRA
jgi:hypothetical protein